MNASEETLGQGRSFVEGVLETTPLLLGVIPFGVICGAVCVDAGVPGWGASGLSIIVFAGASQLVATKLMVESSGALVVVLASLVVNLRLLMYSASIAPHLRDAGLGLRALLAYLLTDQAYATAINRFSDTRKIGVNKPLFYLGSGVLMWVSFNISTVVGVYLGAVIPPEWGLDFAIPLTFIALVAPRITDRASLGAAIVAGLAAVACTSWPYKSGLMVAAVLGIGVGFVWERRARLG